MREIEFILLRFCNQSLFSPATKKLGIQEFEIYVDAKVGLVWLKETGESWLVTRDYQAPPRKGFKIGGLDYFFWCYEHYDGIAVHVDNYAEAIDFCKTAANELGCDFFIVDGE